MDQPQNNSKIFYALMQRIGADHKYQKILLLIWIILGFTIGSTVFSPPFFLLESHYTCPRLTGKECDAYVCSLPPHLRPQYLKTEVSSVATQFGDFHCENKQNVVKAEAFVYIGGIAGVLCGAAVSSHLTKKTILTLTVLLSLVASAIAYFGVSLYMASAGLFLHYACKCIQVEMIYCFINETVDETKRGKHQTIIFMFQALGSAMNGPVMYVLGSWKLFIIFMYVVPSLFMLFFLAFFIHNTVYDSIVHHSAEDTLQMIQKIAVTNGTSDSHMITLEELQVVRDNFALNFDEQDPNEEANHRASMLDLVYYKSVRNKMLLIIVLGLFVQFNFDGPQLMLSEFSMSVYMNGFILGISQVFACIIGYFLVDDFERKKMIFGATTIGLIICIPVAIVTNCHDHCTPFQKVFETVGLFLFRVALSFSFTTFILTQYELFPTQVRGIAVQVVSSTGYLAVSMIPVISKLLLHQFGISVPEFFIINCLIILFLTYFIPETYNNPAPDMIEELYQQYEAKVEGDESIEKPPKVTQSNDNPSLPHP